MIRKILFAAATAGASEALAHFILPPFSSGMGDENKDALIRYSVGTALWAGPAFATALTARNQREAVAIMVAALAGGGLGTAIAYRIHEAQDQSIAGA